MAEIYRLARLAGIQSPGKQARDEDSLRSFELALTREAWQKGLDGVICSHVHKPEIRDISGILYCNDGGWSEHQSAIVGDLSAHYE